MTTFNLTKQDFNSMPLELRHLLFSLCISLIGSDAFSLVLDDRIIKDRDELFDWQVDNLKLFK